MALYVNGDHGTYVHTFTDLKLNIFQKELKNQKKQKYHNKYKIQANDSIIRKYFSLGFTNFMLKGKSLLDHINLFSFNKYEKNGKIITFIQ